MDKSVCFISLLLVCGLVGVCGLQCYVCENCPNAPSSNTLQTCGATTSTTTTVVTSTTLVDPGSTTTVASIAPGTTTTVAPVDPGTTTTVAPVDPGTTTTVAPVDPGTTTTVAPVDPIPPGGRSRRSVLSGTKSEGGCNCKNEANCECDKSPIFGRIANYADVEYLCIKATVKDENNTSIVVRNCVPSLLEGLAPCQFFNMTESCSTCNTDKCNGSFNLQYSVFVLVATACFMLLK